MGDVDGWFWLQVDMDEFSPLNSSSVGDPLGMPMATVGLDDISLPSSVASYIQTTPYTSTTLCIHHALYIHHDLDQAPRTIRLCSVKPYL